jgi:hypothetical protein
MMYRSSVRSILQLPRLGNAINLQLKSIVIPDVSLRMKLKYEVKKSGQTFIIN